MVVTPVISSALAQLWQRATRVERACYLIGALLIGSGLVHIGILIATGASWEGPLSLRKPATFGLSFGLTVITLLGVSSFLDFRARTRSLLMAAFTAMSVLETALISLQAWRGVPSHFNVETPFDALVTRGLAGGGAALIVIVIALTIASFRGRAPVSASTRMTLQAGLAALSAAMAVGGVMIARGMTLVFSGQAADAYATGGAFKPIHAVTMHGVLVLPGLAWLLSLTNWSESRRVRITGFAIGAYVIVILGVTVANLMSL
jgi:hypothetical protein